MHIRVRCMWTYTCRHAYQGNPIVPRHLTSVSHKNFSCSCTQLIDQSHATATWDSVVHHSFIQCPCVASILITCTFPVLDECLLDIYTQAAWNTMETLLMISFDAPTKKKKKNKIKESYSMEKIHIRRRLCLQIKPGSSEKIRLHEQNDRLYSFCS